MKTPPEIFREYDIRGVVDQQLTPELADAIGRALGTFAQAKLGRAPRLAVGRDNRPSGETLARAVREGIAAVGGTAVDVGMLPTPALYFAAETLDVDGALQVTGSHNPPEFNGFKMVCGTTLYGRDIQELHRIIESESWVESVGSTEVDDSVLDSYVDAVVERNGPIERPVKVVVDCGNGVASLVAQRALTRIGADVVPLYCESDGSFPNHHPDPTVPEYLADLQTAVKRENAELGIAFDGDGDRVGAVDENGTMVYGDQLLVLLGRDLARRSGGGHAVIFDVKCSDVLRTELERIGLRPVIWKTGHSLIKAKMKKEGAPLAGEMSGHMFFGGDYLGFDDALFAAARLLNYLAVGDGPLSTHFEGLPKTAATPEIRVPCPDDEKFDLVERAADHFGKSYDVLTLDGARISYDDGWGLIRASNTQPVIVMRFEASDEDALAAHRSEVEEWLREQGVDV